MIKVEQVLEFLNSKECGSILAEYADKKLKALKLPKSMDEFDYNDELLDEVIDYGIAFFCDFGDSDSREDVYVVGYNENTRELLVRGNFGLEGICPVSIDELELYSLLQLAQALFNDTDIQFSKQFVREFRQ